MSSLHLYKTKNDRADLKHPGYSVIATSNCKDCDCAQRATMPVSSCETTTGSSLPMFISRMGRAAIGGQVAQQGSGAKDCGEYRYAAGAVASAANSGTACKWRTCPDGSQAFREGPPARFAGPRSKLRPPAGIPGAGAKSESPGKSRQVQRQKLNLKFTPARIMFSLNLTVSFAGIAAVGKAVAGASNPQLVVVLHDALPRAT